MKKILTIFILLCLTPTTYSNEQNKIEVSSCNRTLTFEKVPTRAVSHDINLTEILFALDLQNNMAGYTGISGWHKKTSEFLQQAQSLPQLASRKPTVETLLAAGTDLFFAGWNYGLSIGSSLTPSSLGSFGIPVYELSESCIHIMKKKRASFDDVFQDINNLGTIFNVQDRSNKLVNQLQTQLNEISSITDTIKHPVPVFLYDSGKDVPFTSGAYAMPNAMIEAAGGKNIMDDLNTSWTRANWEAVVDRNPQLIIIVDYGKVTAQDKIQFLLNHPALSSVNAIKKRNFVIFKYNEVTPSIKNIAATKTLAQRLHALKTHYSATH